MWDFMYFKISRYNTYSFKNNSIDFLKKCTWMCDTLTYFTIEIYKNLYDEVSLYPGSILSVPVSQLQPGNQDY